VTRVSMHQLRRTQVSSDRLRSTRWNVRFCGLALAPNTGRNRHSQARARSCPFVLDERAGRRAMNRLAGKIVVRTQRLAGLMPARAAPWPGLYVP